LAHKYHDEVLAGLENLSIILDGITSSGKVKLKKLAGDEPTPHQSRVGFQQAAAEERRYKRTGKREFFNMDYSSGKPVPRNPQVFEACLEFAKTLNRKAKESLVGGYGGERGPRPSGNALSYAAAETIYHGSYGVDTMTQAPMPGLKWDSGHSFAWATNDGHSPMRPEIKKVNSALQDKDEGSKLDHIEEVQHRINIAEAYANDPEGVTQALMSINLARGATFEPELREIRKNAYKYGFLS